MNDTNNQNPNISQLPESPPLRPIQLSVSEWKEFQKLCKDYVSFNPKATDRELDAGAAELALLFEEVIRMRFPNR